MNIQISDFLEISVAILAGGFGTRLKSITKGKPKVLAEIKKRPFLEYLLHQLDQANFKKVVICTGYLSNQIKKSFGTSYKKLSLYYSHEETPLGTAGSLRKALPLLNSETILVMNGDSFCEVDFKKFWQFHFKKNSKASLALTSVSDTSRFGTVKLARGGSITQFQEKKEAKGRGLINAGVYLVNKNLIAEIPEGRKISLETDLFPNWIGRGFHGYKAGNNFIDIGTPENYALAEQFFARHPLSKQRRFVLLDRDGTIVVEKHYLSNPDQIKLLPGVLDGLKKLKDLGLGVLIVTNQSGIGRKYFDLDALSKIHQKLTDLLLKRGIILDGIYFCPHKPEDNCHCRKPKLGLIEKAAQEHSFDWEECFVIGDKALDIELGKAMKTTTFLVRTGYGSKVEKEKKVQPDYVVKDLLEAADIIQQQLNL